MAVELLLLPGGTAAAGLPVLVHAPDGDGGDRGDRRALSDLWTPVAQPRLPSARRRAVPQRPPDRGRGTHVRRGRARDAGGFPRRAVVFLVRRAQARARIARAAPSAAGRP